MDPFNNFNSGTKSRQGKKPANFIEALKELGSGAKRQVKDATFGTGRTMMDQVLGTPRTQTAPSSGELQPDRPFNFEDYLKSQERQTSQREYQRFEQRLREEKMVFHRKQEEAKLEIKVVQQELKKLADATQGLSQEVKKATLTMNVAPGTYHDNFFDHIRRVIELARKKISESKTWLETFNHRARRRSHYWFSVKKSGTKFMLSQERYMATQAG